MYFEEEFAYPTNLTSGPMVPDEEDEDYYDNQDQHNISQGKDPRVDRQGKSTAMATAVPSGRSIEIIRGNEEQQEDERSRANGGGIGEGGGGHFSQCHPSRNNNTSTGSDLIQVTVEDLLISKEQSRTIKASIDLARQESSRPSVLPIAVANATTITITGAATSPTTKTVTGSSFSPPLTPVPAITTTTITATIRTIGGRGTSFLFDGDSDTAAPDDSSNASVAQLLQASKKPSGSQSLPSSPPISASSERSSPSQLPTANSNNTLSTATATTGTAGTSQGQGQGEQGVSKKHGVSHPPTAISQKPVVPLTPAQQREAEADDNIQRAIELHERNQLEEATHYFRLAAQSENPLGQLMYGLSLRHGWVSSPRIFFFVFFLVKELKHKTEKDETWHHGFDRAPKRY